MLQRDLDDLGELLVALVLEADIAGIDAIFGERLGAGGVRGEQRVAVIVEVADERRLHPEHVEPLADVRHGGGGLGAVNGDADKLGARAGKRRDLRGGRLDVGRVGVGHRLHDDGRAAADRDSADPDGDRALARLSEHGSRIHHICGAFASAYAAGWRPGFRPIRAAFASR